MNAFIEKWIALKTYPTRSLIQPYYVLIIEIIIVMANLDILLEHLVSYLIALLKYW